MKIFIAVKEAELRARLEALLRIFVPEETLSRLSTADAAISSDEEDALIVFCDRAVAAQVAANGKDGIAAIVAIAENEQIAEESLSAGADDILLLPLNEMQVRRVLHTARRLSETRAAFRRLDRERWNCEQARREKEVLTEALDRRLREFQKQHAIGELAAGIAHDFNNILTAILGYVTLCMKVVERGGRAYNYLQEIAKAGHRASELVRRILDFSRQEEERFEAVDLAKVIEDAVALVRPAVPENVRLTIEMKEEVGPVWGSPTQLQQVVLNLCTNAVYAVGSEPGSVCIRLEKRREEGREEAVLSVADSGCGMTQEVLERIFDPYFTTKGKEGGTGFGLSIVRSIVDRHHGRVEVESEPGKGSVFRIFLPILHRDEAKKGTSGTHILFVESNEALREMGREMLESLGFHVTAASGEEEARRLFSTQPESFAALVTDRDLGKEGSGLRLIESCRAIRSELPAVLFGDIGSETLNRRKPPGVITMNKPLDWTGLARRLRRLVSASGREK